MEAHGERLDRTVALKLNQPALSEDAAVERSSAKRARPRAVTARREPARPRALLGDLHELPAVRAGVLRSA